MLQMPENVRAAVPEDEDALIELCRELHAENAPHSFSVDKVREVIRQATRPSNYHNTIRCIGVIGEPKAPLQGAIHLVGHQDWYTEDWSLFEVFNFVRQPYRAGTTNARDLVAWACCISDGLRMKMLIGIISNHRTEAKMRLYQRLLGPQIGAFFMHDGTRGSAH